MTIHRMKLVAEANREKIVEFLKAHLGATYKDISRATGLSEGAVRDHMKQIKSEWRDRVCALRASTLKPGEPTQLTLYSLFESAPETHGSQPPCSKPKGPPA